MKQASARRDRGDCSFADVSLYETRAISSVGAPAASGVQRRIYRNASLVMEIEKHYLTQSV